MTEERFKEIQNLYKRIKKAEDFKSTLDYMSEISKDEKYDHVQEKFIQGVSNHPLTLSMKDMDDELQISNIEALRILFETLQEYFFDLITDLKKRI